MATAPPTAGDIAIPPSSPGLLARLLTGQRLPAVAARLGAGLAASRGRPWRVGTTVVAARHADVRELLSRDLDFVIAPINAKRIDEVNGPFVLGMDRSARLEIERRALYRALAAIDYAPLREAIATEASSRLAGATTIDVVGDFARPIAAHSAQRLFGITGTDETTFEDMARAIFAHTFLNLGGDETVRARAIRAAALMRDWLAEEIARRSTTGTPDPTNDMMGALLRDGQLDAQGARRTLGGMLVGSVDTTASTVAKIVAILGRDPALRKQVATDVGDPDRLRGWCWDVLRRWPHNPILLRQAAAATMLGGTEVEAGDRVVAWTQAAMQDGAVFVDPDRIRPDREPSGYLHLGAGLHPCAGRSVNAFQIPLLVAALLRRGIRSVGKVGWAGSFPAHLPVTLE
jgi:cytochrome P450